MSSWTGIPELKEGYRALGPVRFSIILLGTLTYIGVLSWLTILTDHPQSAGSTCQRKCMIEAYWFSQHLLDGGLVEWLLFIGLWSIPGSVVAAFIYAFVTKRGIFNKNNPE